MWLYKMDRLLPLGGQSSRWLGQGTTTGISWWFLTPDTIRCSTLLMIRNQFWEQAISETVFPASTKLLDDTINQRCWRVKLCNITRARTVTMSHAVKTSMKNGIYITNTTSIGKKRRQTTIGRFNQLSRWPHGPCLLKTAINGKQSVVICRTMWMEWW